MKLGLLDSTETHRCTRWALKWAFAAREHQTGELNTPKSIAVRDDRSSSTIAIRGVFREQNDYFNHRATRGTVFVRCRGVLRIINQRLARLVAAVEEISGVLEDV
ncbi:hypothetical protein E3N88_21299 [Mikania micrantha]|uniref:Uncharacterized protein n=1 Tax=Mikania micrantha TaxID=192012 RepID=A0A5N6NJD4_9ASTR|nr:hypothetical protein E3N88_21299 [Mikania micrantha]